MVQLRQTSASPETSSSPPYSWSDPGLWLAYSDSIRWAEHDHIGEASKREANLEIQGTGLTDCRIYIGEGAFCGNKNTFNFVENSAFRNVSHVSKLEERHVENMTGCHVMSILLANMSAKVLEVIRVLCVHRWLNDWLTFQCNFHEFDRWICHLIEILTSWKVLLHMHFIANI